VVSSFAPAPALGLDYEGSIVFRANRPYTTAERRLMENYPDAGAFSANIVIDPETACQGKNSLGFLSQPLSPYLLPLPETAPWFSADIFEMHYNYTKVPDSLLFLKNFLKIFQHFFAPATY